MFNWLTHSKTRLRMMKMFFRDVDEPLYGLEIAKALKVSPGTTHRELNAMIRQGILKKKREGALVLYRLNTGHPYFAELKKAVFPNPKQDAVLFVGDLHLTVDTAEEVLADFNLFLDYAAENAAEVVFLGDMVELLEGDVFQTFLLHKPLFDRIRQLAKQLKITYLVGNHDVFLKLWTDVDNGHAAAVSGHAAALSGHAAALSGHAAVCPYCHIGVNYRHGRLGIYAAHGNQYDDLDIVKNYRGKSRGSSTGRKAMVVLQNLSREGYSLHQNKLLALSGEAERIWKYVYYSQEHQLNYGSRLQKIAKDLIKTEDYSYVVFGHSHQAMLKKMGSGIYLNPGSFGKDSKRHFVEIDHDGAALIVVDELR